jgi:hypothetical protein
VRNLHSLSHGQFKVSCATRDARRIFVLGIEHARKRFNVRRLVIEADFHTRTRGKKFRDAGKVTLAERLSIHRVGEDAATLRGLVTTREICVSKIVSSDVTSDWAAALDELALARIARFAFLAQPLRVHMTCCCGRDQTSALCVPTVAAGAAREPSLFRLKRDASALSPIISRPVERAGDRSGTAEKHGGLCVFLKSKDSHGEC